ncbi:MAG: hypothetical protein J6S19_02895, partial [Lentisphaeria bacterium]|nr:hypothetical protein [Lentisphaeria bacterium]
GDFWRSSLLKSEKELLGFYVTAHPLSPYKPAVESLSTTSFSQLENIGESATVRIAGMLNTVSKKFSKRYNRPYLIWNM